MMLKQVLIGFLLIAFAVLNVAVADVDEQTVEAIRALWSDQTKALDEHDADGVMATYADSDDIMLMGTGPGEHWVGKEEIKDAYAHFMEDFEARTLQSQCGEGHGASQGDVVWFTAVCTFSGPQEIQQVMNLSAVVIKQGDAWRFHTMHFSNLTGNPDSESK